MPYQIFLGRAQKQTAFAQLLSWLVCYSCKNIRRLLKVTKINKNLDFSIESLRGIAILCVVFIHSTTNEKFSNINLFIDIFSKFAVPLFIFISGYFVYRQRELIIKNFDLYILKSLKKIGIPYIVLSIIITLFTYNSYYDFLINIFFGTASVPYYFIIVIAQLYLLSKLILLFYEKRKKLLVKIAIGSTFFYSTLFYLQLFLKGSIFIPYFMWQFPNYLLYFVFGIDMAAKGYIYHLIYDLNNRRAFIYFLFGLLIALIEVKIHYIRNEQEGDYIALASIVYQSIAVLYFWKLRGFLKNKLFIHLGYFSFGIFLLHKPILDIFKKVFNLEINILYGILSIILSVIVVLVFNKFYSEAERLIFRPLGHINCAATNGFAKLFQKRP